MYPNGHSMREAVRALDDMLKAAVALDRDPWCLDRALGVQTSEEVSKLRPFCIVEADTSDAC
jgi:hypothetical protein